MNRAFFLKNLWLWKCGMLEMNMKEKMIYWSYEFEKLMRNRMKVGCIRYGHLKKKNKPQYKRVEYILNKTKEYNKTRNKELLVDIANLCMLEYEEGTGVFYSEHDKNHVAFKG